MFLIFVDVNCREQLVECATIHSKKSEYKLASRRKKPVAPEIKRLSFNQHFAFDSAVIRSSALRRIGPLFSSWS